MLKTFIDNFSNKSKIETIPTKLYDLQKNWKITTIHTSVDKQFIVYWFRVLNKVVHTFALWCMPVIPNLFINAEPYNIFLNPLIALDDAPRSPGWETFVYVIALKLFRMD